MATKTNTGGSTLEEFIAEYRVENLTIDKYFLQQVIDATGSSSSGKIVLNEDSFRSKYLDEFEDAKSFVTLSDEEKSKYRYNPKLMSFDVYGTTELWFLILWANELYSSTEFTLETNRLTMYNSTILEKLERIIDLNHEIKKENANDVRSAVQA